MFKDFSLIKLSDFLHKNEFQKLLDSIYSLLKPIEENYPNFREWFYNTVSKGIEKGTREIFLYTHFDKVIGCIILKNDSEKKICTFFIDEEFQRNGLGTNLLKSGIEYLGNKDILLTVSKRNESKYLKLLEKFNFKKLKEENTYNRKNNPEVYYIN